MQPRLLALLCAIAACTAAEPLALSLSFSSDAGRTWAAEAPPLPVDGGRLRVRLRWLASEPPERREPFIPVLSAAADFASADRGAKDWGREGEVRHFQSAQPSWVGQSGAEAVIELDPGARPVGVMGRQNRWEAAGKRFVDEPLPACAARGPGEHPFLATVWYRRSGGTQRVMAEVPFTVRIGGAAAAPPAAAAALPELRTLLPLDLTPGGVRLSAEDLVALEGGQLTRRPGWARGCVATWQAGPGHAGRWWPTLQVAVGDNLAIQLRLQTPWLYRNGRGVPFTTAGQLGVLPGIGAVVELRASEPLEIAVGDELRLAPGAIAARWVGGLGLHPAAPAAGLGDVWPFLAPDAEDRWRAQAAIAMAAEGGAVEVRLSARPAGLAAGTAEVRWRVLDYYQQELAAGSAACTGPWTHALRVPVAASDRFRVVLSVAEPGWQAVEAVGETLADTRWNAGRSRTWLGEGWTFHGRGDGASGMEAPPEAEAAGTAVALPLRWDALGGAQRCAWLVRPLRVDAPGAGRRLLRLARSPGGSSLWIDGRQLATHHGQAPFTVDVTDALAAPGTHLVQLAMRQGGNRSWGATQLNYCAEITLDEVPAAHVADLRIATSLQDHRLDAAAVVAGAPAGARLRGQVLHRGRPLLTLPEAAVGADGRASLSAAWADPPLWEPERPELLRLDAELVDGAGNVLDRGSWRFGFRELRAAGTSLLLNGVPVKLRATAMDGVGRDSAAMRPAAIRERIRRAIRYGSQMHRHAGHWDSGLDAADEEGLLATLYVTNLPHQNQAVLDDDALWRAAAAEAAGTVAGLGNHPAVGIWYISNEFAETASDPALAVRRLTGVAEAVRAADPLRLVEAGCDLDLRGWNGFISTHYPVDVNAVQDPACYLPDAALWRRPDAGFTPGMAVPGGQQRRVANVRDPSPMRWGEKPIVVGEMGWNMFMGPPGGMAGVVGDAAYRGSIALDLAHRESMAWFAAGDRDAGASLITPWVQPFWGGCLTAVPAVDAWPWTRHACWYAGEAVAWEVALHHDRRSAGPARFVWTLVGADGRVLASGGEDLVLAPAELKRVRLAFTAPAVDCREHGTLSLALTTPDGLGAPRSFPVAIHPRPAAGWPQEGVALFDPDGATAAALAQVGWQPPRIARPDRAALSRLYLLVIGVGAGRDPALCAAGADLQAFVSAGGAVLALRQDAIDPVWAGATFRVTGKRSSRVFRRAPGHPVLAGLDDADLRDWFPDHLVAAGELLKPVAGDFTCLVDAALGGGGQDYTALLDWRSGAGRIVFCQLDLIPRLGRQPVADLLLRRLVEWAAGDRHGHRPAVVAADPGSAMLRALRGAGLQVATADDPAAPLLVDAARIPDAATRAAWRARVQAGGTLLVHGITPAAQAWVGELLGRPVRLAADPSPDFAARALLLAPHPSTAGIANSDLFWRSNSLKEQLHLTFVDPAGVIEPLGSAALVVEGGVPLLYPPYLVDVPLGGGHVLLDNLRWESDAALIVPKARRLAASLCANLGASLAARRQRTWLGDLDFQAVDLAPLANRTLADDRADDGIGGWSDQGPACDLRAWPVGRQVRRGIPFTVAEGRSCVVLASRYRPGEQPEMVEIPIGRRVRALFMLQSGAWINRVQHGSYVVRYADGGSVEIPLVGGLNMHDWQGRYGDEVSAEEVDTYTRHAGAVAVPACGRAGAFVMQWENPHPTRPVAALEFRSLRQGVMILMGLTLGLDPAAVDTAPGDRVAAEGLRATARGAAPAVAVAALAEALRLDPSLDAARLDLAQAQLRAGDAGAAERTLHTALRARPGLLQGYADLAAILEAQERWDEAVAVWRRSLAANPNQPEAWQALDRTRRQAGGE